LSICVDASDWESDGLAIGFVCEYSANILRKYAARGCIRVVDFKVRRPEFACFLLSVSQLPQVSVDYRIR